jgi:hypothetical protein
MIRQFLKFFRFLSLLSVTAGTLFMSPLISFADLLPPPTSFSGPEFEVEDLSAQFNSGLLIVSGKIRNKSFRTVKGSVLIYLRNAGNGVVTTAEESVNKGISFSHEEGGAFESSISVPPGSGINNVSVEFIEQKQPIKPVVTGSPRLNNTPPLPQGSILPTPPVAPQIKEKINKCKSKGGNWINGQCIIALD